MIIFIDKDETKITNVLMYSFSIGKTSLKNLVRTSGFRNVDIYIKRPWMKENKASTLMITASMFLKKIVKGLFLASMKEAFCESLSIEEELWWWFQRLDRSKNEESQEELLDESSSIFHKWKIGRWLSSRALYYIFCCY